MRKTVYKLLALLCVLALACTLTGCGQNDESKYADAKKKLEKGEYGEALTAFTELGDYEESKKYVQYIKAVQLAEDGKYELALSAFANYVGDFLDSAELVIYYTARACEDEGDQSAAMALYAQIPLTRDSADRYQYFRSIWNGSLAAGDDHTVGLKTDGTVVAVGDNEYGQCDVGGWRDVVAVSAWVGHTVGLKADGTVVAVGLNGNGQCDVGGWRDVVAVSAGSFHTVGLKADGTVVAVGYNGDGQCDVSGWTNIGRRMP